MKKYTSDAFEASSEIDKLGRDEDIINYSVAECGILKAKKQKKKEIRPRMLLKTYNVFSQPIKPLKYSILAVIFLFAMISQVIGAEDQTIQLRILGWGDLPAYETSFEEYALTKGVKVDLVHVEPFLAEETDVFDGLRGERTDVILIPNKMILREQAQLTDLLHPISINELLNYHLIDASIRTTTAFNKMDEIDGVKYGVPYRGDIQTILYNAKKLKKAPGSWNALLSEAHRKKVSPFYQTEYNVGAILLAMGYEPEAAYNMAAQNIDWEKVSKNLEELALNSYGFWDWPPSDKLIEECELLYGYGLLLRFSNLKDNNWQVAIPKEGVQLWVDDFCISAGVKRSPEKLKAAYLFIDYMLSDAMQIKVYEDQYYIPVTDSALTQLSTRDVRINKSFYKNHSHTLMQPMNVRTRNFYKLLWEQAVNAADSKQP